MEPLDWDSDSDLSGCVSLRKVFDVSESHFPQMAIGNPEDEI